MNEQIVEPKEVYERINTDSLQVIQDFIESCCEPNQSWIWHVSPQIDSRNPDLLYSFRITEEIKGTLYHLGICTLVKSQFDRMTDKDKNKIRDDVKRRVSVLKMQIKNVSRRVVN